MKHNPSFFHCFIEKIEWTLDEFVCRERSNRILSSFRAIVLRTDWQGKGMWNSAFQPFLPSPLVAPRRKSSSFLIREWDCPSFRGGRGPAPVLPYANFVPNHDRNMKKGLMRCASALRFPNGADGENRTLMGSPHAPQTCASTNSATSAIQLEKYISSFFGKQEKLE